MPTNPEACGVTSGPNVAGFVALVFVFAMFLVPPRYAQGAPKSANLIGVEIIDLARESQQNWLPDSAMMGEPYAKIRFSYDEELVKLAKENSWLLTAFASPCKDGQFDPRSRLDDVLGVRDEVGIIAFVRLLAPDSSVQAAAPYQYHIYVRVASYGERALFKYDLRQQSTDVCFHIAAHGRSGSIFKTNVVRVPQEQLKQAFAAFERNKRPLERGGVNP